MKKTQSQNLLQAEPDPNSGKGSQTKQTVKNTQPGIQQTEEQPTIDPISQLITNSNPMPILAVLNRYQLEQQVQPGRPLINFLCNKFLPLDIIMEGRKVQLKADCDERTPLHYAVEADDVKAVYWCLQNGNPHQRDQSKYSPIMIAIKNGYRRCFLLLLEYKHYDQCAPHVAAAYNRVWELQILNSLGYNYTNSHDSSHRTPIDVAVQNYSYQAAQYLAVLDKSSYNINKLQNLTDSKVIIRRIKQAVAASSTFQSTILPLAKVVFSLVTMYILLALCEFTTKQSSFFGACFAIIILLYISLIVVDRFCKAKSDSRDKILELLKAPDFPTLEQVCPKCLHRVTSEYDHCDSCGCCVRNFHFHDWICINSSNQLLWAILQFFWLYVIAAALHLIYTAYLNNVSSDVISSVPFLLIPVSMTQNAWNQKSYITLVLIPFLTLFLAYQLFYCLEIFGIMVMGRTYRQVNNTEQYQHLYRTVKMRNGTFRNKQIRVFGQGIVSGLAQMCKNVASFVIGC